MGEDEVIKAAKAAIARAYFDAIIDTFRTTARDRGYAIAVHGSIARDIDLVAIPWTEQACSAQDLVAALLQAAKVTCDGEGYMEKPEEVLVGVVKPHGRRCWNIHVDGTYIDLSVMPRAS